MTTKEFINSGPRGSVLVRTPRAAELGPILTAAGAEVEHVDEGAIRVLGMEAATIGDLAVEAGIAVHELGTEQGSLEETFMELTRDSVEFRAHANAPETGR
jgi:ABC-2 type transport system ATP-binding protein